MGENKKPRFDSIEELTDFFDNNDVGQYFGEMPEAQFDAAVARCSFLVSVDENLMKKLTELAKSQQTSTQQLINSWLQEKVARAS